jgi:hypothetical protein
VSPGVFYRADIAAMDMTLEHIYNKTCAECDRPALTFDKDNRALCPQHALTFIMAQPVDGELLPASVSAA